MGGMDDGLAAFVAARLDEDEAAAKAASPGPWHPDAESGEVLAVDNITVCDGFALSGRQLRATTDHIAHNDPARTLRRVAASRAILKRYENLQHPRTLRERAIFPALAEVVLACIRDLAAEFSDHPDYAGALAAGESDRTG